MGWYKISTQNNINDCLKNIIKNNGFIRKMFDINSVPIDMIDTHLTFKFKNLKGKKALSDSKLIVFDENVFNNGIDSEENMHYLIHELYHWIKRQKEKTFYFADPEEIEAFVLGITYELLRGIPSEAIAKIYYPIIEDHFDENQDAQKMFKALLEKAKKNVMSYKGV